MKHKKSQSEIVTTILIILLVLGAIVIVWEVVNHTLNPQAPKGCYNQTLTEDIPISINLLCSYAKIQMNMSYEVCKNNILTNAKKNGWLIGDEKVNQAVTLDYIIIPNQNYTKEVCN